ncbi:MAG: methyltransferase [Acidobacteriota bacterium]
MPLLRRAQILAGLGFVAFGLLMTPVWARQLGSRPTADWIAMMERPERIAGLKVDQIVARLDLKPGQTVADIGAGPGIFSFALAKAVGPTGKVYAEEVDPAFLDHITAALKDRHVENVRPVLGIFTDPKLPARDVDLAFFHDVLHHVDDRIGFLKALAPYLKPTGRVAIIEYDAENGPHKAQPALQITRVQLDAWMAEIGFKPIQSIGDLFTDKDPRWGAIYGRQ